MTWKVDGKKVFWSMVWYVFFLIKHMQSLSEKSYIFFFSAILSESSRERKRLFNFFFLIHDVKFVYKLVL
jgi:hypothetical protein